MKDSYDITENVGYVHIQEEIFHFLSGGDDFFESEEASSEINDTLSSISKRYLMEVLKLEGCDDLLNEIYFFLHHSLNDMLPSDYDELILHLVYNPETVSLPAFKIINKNDNETTKKYTMKDALENDYHKYNRGDKTRLLIDKSIKFSSREENINELESYLYINTLKRMIYNRGETFTGSKNFDNDANA